MNTASRFGSVMNITPAITVSISTKAWMTRSRRWRSSDLSWNTDTRNGWRFLARIMPESRVETPGETQKKYKYAWKMYHNTYQKP